MGGKRTDPRTGHTRVGPGRDTPGWLAFRRYYIAMTPEDREKFVQRLGSTDRYIRTAIFRGKVGAAMALRIELESKGVITRDMVFSRWQEIWPDWKPPKSNKSR